MDVPARGWTGRSDPDSEGSAHARRVAEAQSAGEDRAHSKTREIKMQVSPPPPTGGAGQHHQVEPGEESTPCEHTARYFQYRAAGDQPRLIQGIRRRDGVGEDQETIA